MTELVQLRARVAELELAEARHQTTATHSQREAELNESQRIARIGSWEWTPATGVITWSDGMNHVLGRARSLPAPTFEALPQFYTPESWQRLGVVIARALEQGSSYDLEVEMIRADGGTCWATTRGEAIRGADGTVVKLRGTVHDITERKRVTNELRGVASRLTAVLDNITDGFFSLDRELRYTDINNAGATMVGRTPARLIGRRLLDEFPQAVDTRFVKAYRRVLDTGEAAVIEDYFAPLKKWFEARVYPSASGILVFFSDITERKRAEESLRLQSAALFAAADAIVITDRHGSIEWINPTFTLITGYSAEEALGRHHRDLVQSGKHTKAFFKDLWDTIIAGRTWRGEIINRRKDGRLYTENQSVTPIVDASGAITHFVSIQQDITERLQLEAQFRQAQKMESVGQLTSGIAHDFNNLLTVINGMADLVLEQVSRADPVRPDVEEIRRAGERAATLTGQLLAFSRQQILAPRVLSVTTVVGGMQSLLRRLLREDIDLVVVPTSDVCHVLADPGQLEQVLTNLAVNARDAMPQGGQLTIETHNVTIDEAPAHVSGEAVPPGVYALLAVTDSGVGMDEAVRARIFEPFFTTKGPGKGTGLGLATVFGIVKQSQGFIRVYSEYGHGTSFKIYLPLVTDAAAGANRAVPSGKSITCTETILVVEDSVGLRALATRILEREGYKVLGAATGAEALRLLNGQHEPVHLLLTDVVMPGMSGRLLAEQVAKTHPQLKVLYMSGYTSDTVVRHGVLDAQMPFLNKPFTAMALLRRVRDVLDSDH